MIIRVYVGNDDVLECNMNETSSVKDLIDYVEKNLEDDMVVESLKDSNFNNLDLNGKIKIYFKNQDAAFAVLTSMSPSYNSHTPHVSNMLQEYFTCRLEENAAKSSKQMIDSTYIVERLRALSTTNTDERFLRDLLYRIEALPRHSRQSLPVLGQQLVVDMQHLARMSSS